MRKIGNFIALPFMEKLSFAEATILLIYAKVLIKFLPLRYWKKHIDVAPEGRDEPAEMDVVAHRHALVVLRAIARAARHSPVEFVCLPQALAARWMLARRDVPNAMHIGTKRERGVNREFHAWLKVGNMMVTGHCDESEYVTFNL